jgi:GMP synthase-like glutamine amidotransferase
MKALVLQHIACEPPGLYEDILRERESTITRVELDAGERLPDWHDFDAILAMGGPMSVNDEGALPWLRAEKRLIADAVDAGKPFWGVCLGVQLLASSLGGRVYPGPRPEVGVLPVSLTDDALLDPVFRGLPRDFLALQWHGDTFDLPKGAVRLAGSVDYPNQAFKRRNAYGLQFHLEVSNEMVREWAAVPEYADYLERVLGPGSGERLLRQVKVRVDDLHEQGRVMFERWLDVVVGMKTPLPAARI